RCPQASTLCPYTTLCRAGGVALWQAKTASAERSTAVAERQRAETALAATERELLRAQTAELRGLVLRIDRLLAEAPPEGRERLQDRKSTRLNSSHVKISY